MPERLCVPITELVNRTATRFRAKEAFERLMQLLTPLADMPTDVTVDLSSTVMVTGSFLDEFVRLAKNLPSCVQLKFRLASDDDAKKLERVCTIRAVACCYQLGASGKLRSVRHRTVSRSKARSYSGVFFAT